MQFIKRFFRQASNASTSTSLSQPRIGILPSYTRAELLQGAKKRNLVNLYYYKVYEELMKSQEYFMIISNNNYTAKEYKEMKRRVKEEGMIVTMIKNALFGVVYEHVYGKSIRHVLVGPTFVIFDSRDDLGAVKNIRNLVGKKGLFVAGVYEGQLLSSDEFVTLSSFSSKKLLRQELLSILTPHQLLNTLKTPAQSLQSTIQAIIPSKP